MSTRQRWFATLCAICCAAGLAVNAGAQPPADPQSPPVLKDLPAATRIEPAPPAPASDKRAEKTEPGEPAVRQTVVEDDGARIDELKVRGQTKRITVTPKKGGKPYEIITSNGARDQTEGPNGSNGAIGKRVWPVLSF